MRALMARTLFILFVAAVMTGCKIAVIVPSGGQLFASNPAHSCSEGNVCEFDINVGQLPFSESFTAIPKEGYEFEKWSDGSGFLCGKSTNPICAVNIGDSAVGAVVVALFQSGYVMPIFKDVGIDTDDDGVRNELDPDDDNDGILDLYDPCPIDADTNCGIVEDIVIAAGKQWYQVDLFANLSVTDIRTVCNPVCSSGILSGKEMEGWVFASREEVSDLVNNVKSIAGDGWAPYLFDTLKFRPLSVPTSLDRFIFGRTSSTFIDASGNEFGYSANVWDFDSRTDSFRTNGVSNVSVWQSSVGAWFYRTP